MGVYRMIVVMKPGASSQQVEHIKCEIERLGLRSTVKLHLPPELLDTALDVLRSDGFSARGSTKSYSMA